MACSSPGRAVPVSAGSIADCASTVQRDRGGTGFRTGGGSIPQCGRWSTDWFGSRAFNQQPYDSLALSDTRRFSSAAQAGKECGEGLCQAQECSSIVGLVGDRL